MYAHNHNATLRDELHTYERTCTRQFHGPEYKVRSVMTRVLSTSTTHIMMSVRSRYPQLRYDQDNCNENERMRQHSTSQFRFGDRHKRGAPHYMYRQHTRTKGWRANGGYIASMRENFSRNTPGLVTVAVTKPLMTEALQTRAGRKQQE